MVVRKKQAQIEKQKTQIDELLKRNSQLIKKIGTTTNTNTGGATSGGAEDTHHGRYRGNRNTNGNGKRNTNSNETRLDTGAGTNNRTNILPNCAVCPFCTHATADSWELSMNKNKRPDIWTSFLE